MTRLAGRASAATPLTRASLSVRGSVVIDPIQDWVTITRPKARLVSVDVLDACDYALGHLDDLILRAETELPPSIGAEAMHPAVWGPVARLWRDGHFREAVAAAAESVVGMVKARTGRDDVSATDLWRQTFSDENPPPGQLRLRWPGDPDNQDVKTMNSGLLLFAPGVQMTIRNSPAHDLDEQAALERLSTLSLLAPAGLTSANSGQRPRTSRSHPKQIRAGQNMFLGFAFECATRNSSRRTPRRFTVGRQ